MDRESAIEIFFGLLGMFFFWVSVILREVQLLAWIGVWIIFITLYWDYHRMRKEARKQGKEILI